MRVIFAPKSGAGLGADEAQAALFGFVFSCREGEGFAVASPDPGLDRRRTTEELEWLGVRETSGGGGRAAGFEPNAAACRLSELGLAAEGSGRSLCVSADSAGGPAVAELRAGGYLAEAVVNYLLLLGWRHPESVEVFSLAEAAELFSGEQLRTAREPFETAALDRLNARWIKRLPAEAVSERAMDYLGEYRALVQGRGEVFWVQAVEKLRSSVTSLTQFLEIGRLLFSLEVSFSKEARERHSAEQPRESLIAVLKCAQELLSDTVLEEDQDRFSEAQFSKAVKMICKLQRMDRRPVLQALEIGITGRTGGDFELKRLFSLIARDVLLERLRSSIGAASLLQPPPGIGAGW